MTFRVLETAVLFQSGITLAQELFPGTSIFEPLFPTAVSEYVGACPASVPTGSGFNVEARICSDAHHYSSSDNLGLVPFTGQVDNGDGAGNNEGPAPPWYLYTRFFGCKNGFERIGLTETGSINPKFVSDYVYDGDTQWNQSGVKDPNFSVETLWPTTGEIYGHNKTQTYGFSLELTGYYLAPKTGEYTFNITADSEASLQLGRGSNCCGTFRDGIVTSDITSTVITLWQPTLDVIYKTNTYTVRLVEGEYYPIRVVYFNGIGSFVFNLSVIKPDGSISSDFSDVKQLDPSACRQISTQTWTGSYVTDNLASGGNAEVIPATGATTSSSSSGSSSSAASSSNAISRTSSGASSTSGTSSGTPSKSAFSGG